jgi:predicted enzyme related to lactoylglutathione lyase
MAISNALASVAVKNLSASSKWYEQLFGRPPDAQPMAEVMEWKFDGGGEIQVYELAERAGQGSATFTVTSIDEERARLKELSAKVPEVIESGQFRVIMISDPDGNSLAFAQPRQ